MDTNTQYLADMGIRLTELAVRGTASIVQKKVRSIKTEKNLETLRSSYDSLLNEVLSEREEAIRIAQVYKEELDQVKISEEDIVYLHKTIEDLLNLLKQFMDVNDSIEDLEKIKELVNVNTLRTMQLLGFNYKAAIGEPLTEVCASYINSLGQKGRKNVGKKKNK